MEIARKVQTWQFEEHGRSPGRVDCFGLFLFVTSWLGYTVPDYSYRWEWADEGGNLFVENYHKYADPIERSQVGPGDVIFLCTDRSRPKVPSHIGIMIDRDHFLHCGCKTAGVLISKSSRLPWAVMVHSFYRLKSEIKA